MKLATDCVQVEQRAALTELKGAARAYYLSQPQAQVWRHKRVGMWHLVQATTDPDAKGCSFKQFVTEGPHLGWVRADAQGELTFLRKDFTALPAGRPGAAPTGPGKGYGEELLVYGSGHCARCNEVHEERFHLEESRRSRFRLLQFVAEMSGFAGGGKGTKSRTQIALGDQANALRSMRGGIPLVDVATARHGGADIRSRVVTLLREQGDLTLKDLYQQLGPKETVTPGKGKQPIVTPLSEDKFASVLAVLTSSGNVSVVDGTPKKFRLMEIGLRPGGITAVTAETTGEFMVGILVCPEKTFVAASGPGLDNPKFRAVAARKGYTICIPRSADTVPRTTIYGSAISRDVYAGAKDPTASDPGICAAPRLIQQATDDGGVNKRKHELWAMSEIYYLPNTAKRTNQQNNGLYWLHGLSAHSCKTCEKLVPILLCPGGSYQLPEIGGSPS